MDMFAFMNCYTRRKILSLFISTAINQPLSCQNYKFTWTSYSAFIGFFHLLNIICFRNDVKSFFSLEVTTQDAVTPSFAISSALREPDQLGSEVYEELVGEEIYWTIDIPSKTHGFRIAYNFCEGNDWERLSYKFYFGIRSVQAFRFVFA